jgi:hypothetical protein
MPSMRLVGIGGGDIGGGRSSYRDSISILML